MRRKVRSEVRKAVANTAVANTPPVRAFALALVAGLAWTFGLLYSEQASALLLTGEWAWAPFAAEAADSLAVLAAVPGAGPPAVLGAALLPCAALLCFARSALGRHLFGPRPRPGQSWGPEQLPRLAGLGLALVLFLVLGGAS